jgi:hypothetical protein
MQDLASLRDMFKASPMTIFGHADPVGDDVYNHHLSGRRAAAIYGLLTRDVDLWEKLYSKPYQGDNWKPRGVQTMLTAIGYDTKGVDGIYGANTIEAMKKFQKDNGISPTGSDTAPTRKVLFLAYMNYLCVDSGGKPYTVGKGEFLSKNLDQNGKGDYQGCSEFNPVLIFSKQQTADFKKPARKTERDAANGPNRRVTALLFHKDTFVPPDKWPCPYAGAGVADCKKRFWSDYQRRLEPGEQVRTFEKDRDTFACRFYHRLNTGSPCEESVKYWILRVLEASDTPLYNRKPVANAAYLITGENGEPPQIKGSTDAQGILRIRATSEKAKLKLIIAGCEVLLDAGELFASGTNEAASRQRLCNLGYGPAELASWTNADAKAAYELFQTHYGLQKSGTADAPTVEKLKEIHGS